MTSGRPTKEELEAAVGGHVGDVLRPGLTVLFCGVNPGLWSAAVGHHFAHPSNRFWKVLHLAGFTDRRLGPDEERQLLALGLGVTNVVDRATRSAKDLRPEELRHGVRSLEDKVRRYHPAAVAVVGVGAYRVGFGRPHAVVGPQPQGLGPSGLWVLPNPSGAQARYQLAELVDAFRALRIATAQRPDHSSSSR